ncbi:hypothetical protein T12_4532 [Trichinella patagoniensis]|uniref:Uncharacterized protein n=1 Tax=Trichinella patagoniensis TaxID=990121 RepID=A0A0V1ABH6_9BILA|nr:hypothetical protein T12_4532 [Trichinella patagoniensis]
MNSNVQNLRTAAVSVNGRIGETELPVLGEWGRQYCAPYAERTPSFVRLCSCPLVNQRNSKVLTTCACFPNTPPPPDFCLPHQCPLLLYIFPFRLRNTHAFSELLKLRFWFSYFDVQSAEELASRLVTHSV